MGKLKLFDDEGKLQNFDPSGSMSVTDNDNQHNALFSVAEILGGIVVHSSTSSPGNVQLDSGANIIAGANDVGLLKDVGDTITCYYINDGDQVLTFVVGTDCAIADTGQTLGNNEASLLLFHRNTLTTVKMYGIGG